VAGKSIWQGEMEDDPKNGKESSHSAHANVTEYNKKCSCVEEIMTGVNRYSSTSVHQF
jgi:hypothetical protein